MKENKGQTTVINLIMLFVSFIVYMYLLPILSPIIASTVASLNAAPTEFTPLIVILLNMLEFIMLLQLVMTGFHYAIPRTEGQR